MQYREIGKTGKMASVIGLGCEHLDLKPYAQVKETIDAALAQGINIMDVFMPGEEVRKNIANALGERRKDVLLQGHIGSSDIGVQYDISRDMPTVKKYFEQYLKLFGHIDFGMLFFIDSEEDYSAVFDKGLADYAIKLKNSGDISHIGFSSHNPEIAMRAVETGVPEMMLFSINLAFDSYPESAYVLDELEAGLNAGQFRGINPKRAALYRLCEKKGVGITVMKTLGAGKLISKEHTPFPQPMTATQCIHYALNRPSVASVLLGMQSREEVLSAMRYFEAGEEERDYTVFINTLQNDYTGNCVYCGHCQPCPAQIDIAAINKYLDIARLDIDHVPPSIKLHYQALENGAGQCISCGQCETRCPFGVKIIDNMAQAAKLFL